ncbi:MAG: DEAD/DEAH box helicase [Pseudomonadota bacterium]
MTTQDNDTPNPAGEPPASDASDAQEAPDTGTDATAPGDYPESAAIDEILGGDAVDAAAEPTQANFSPEETSAPERSADAGPEQQADAAAEQQADTGPEQASETPLDATTAETSERAEETEQSPVADAPAAESATTEDTAAEAAETAAADGDAEPVDAEEASAETEGDDVAPAAPMELASFNDFALPVPLLRALEDLQFDTATPIQTAVLPYSLSDYDVTGQAQTGTGKTAAFLITMLTSQWENERRGAAKPGSPRALILAPTRELALQIEADAISLAKYIDCSIVAVVGGMDMNKQRDALHAGPLDILVATPGRLLDFVQRRDIYLKDVETLVIDEADRMLDMGFIPDVRRIVYQTPHKKQRQTLFFSATFNDDVMRLAASWTLAPEHVVIEPDQVAADTVDQQFWLVGNSEKRSLLARFIKSEKPSRTIVFVNRRDQTRDLHAYLVKQGVNAEQLSGEVPQTKRLRTLDRFKSGAISTLVATDVAGRGIHVEGISHVINFHLPEDPEDYVHRIGRTGRAGAEGTAVSFVDENEAFSLPDIEEYLGRAVNCVQPPL